MKILLVIDCQASFINDYTKPFVKKIESLIETNKYDKVIFTKYCNNVNSNFCSELNYFGCIKEEDRKIVIDTKDNKIMEKEYYSAYTNEFKEYIKDINKPEIYLCGFDTDACVLKTALDLFEENINVKILEEYCMSHAGIEIHRNAINILKRLIGDKNII